MYIYINIQKDRYTCIDKHIYILYIYIYIYVRVYLYIYVHSEGLARRHGILHDRLHRLPYKKVMAHIRQSWHT